MPWIDQRRIQLTQMLLDAELEEFGFQATTPLDPTNRGSHVTFAHPEAWRINLALIEANVIPDFRAPNFLRLGVTPLYIEEADIAEAISRLRKIMQSRTYEKFPAARPTVT